MDACVRRDLELSAPGALAHFLRLLYFINGAFHTYCHKLLASTASLLPLGIRRLTDSTILCFFREMKICL